MKAIGLIAGVIVVVGILLVGSQYFGNLTDGASADVPRDELIPPTVSMTKEQYQGLVAQFEAYSQATDLAHKNEIITALRESFYGLVTP